MSTSRIAIFASGNGTNAEAIIKYFLHHPTIKVVLLLTNNPDAYAITRAANHSVPSKVFDKNTFRETETILVWLHEHEVTHIVLAGFLWLIPAYLIRSFQHRIINIHPALLPRYGGKGMYGMRVHEMVRGSGDTETGITIHLIDEEYDRGPILFQDRCVIDTLDDAKTIADKVHQLEYQNYPKVIESWILQG